MIKRIFLRAYHLGERIIRETRAFPGRRKSFGFSVAFAAWWDGLIPPGKSEKYIRKMEAFVDKSMSELTQLYSKKATDSRGCLNTQRAPKKNLDKIPVWCCWWQGKENMPELVQMCNRQLQQMIPPDIARLHIITLENYREYVEIPELIIQKFEKRKITMTTMSDILRFQLLGNYGGFWVDSTVYISGKIPQDFFEGRYFSQKMEDTADWPREACKGRWCGFLMAGPSHHVIFEYMNAAFQTWWEKYDDIVDYVLIDYLLLSGYKGIPAIRAAVDHVKANNEHVFRMYGLLNEPYTRELYHRLTKDTVFHKLTYKMDLHKITDSSDETLYQYLLKQAGM